MNAANTTRTSAMNTAWRHLDAVCVGDNDDQPRNLVRLATEAVEQVKAALLSGKPIDRAELASLLDATAWQLHQTHAHIGEVVAALGDFCVDDATGGC